MVEVIATSHVGKKYTKKYLEDELGLKIALSLVECEDCKSVDVIDGFTGELLFEF